MGGGHVSLWLIRDGAQMAFIDRNSLACLAVSSDFEDQLEKPDIIVEPRSISTESLSIEIIERLEDIQARILQIENTSVHEIGDEIEYSDDIKFYKWLKAEYANRLFRQGAFEQDYITGEPCWDALLDLCIAEIEGHRVSVTSLCIASGVPVTTALRWIALLERDDMIERQADLRDKRRTFLRITKRAFENMFEYHRRITKNRKCPMAPNREHSVDWNHCNTTRNNGLSDGPGRRHAGTDINVNLE